MVHGLSCSAACGIFPDQGSNRCPLHWQADSQPLRHQGSPLFILLTSTSISALSTQAFLEFFGLTSLLLPHICPAVLSGILFPQAFMWLCFLERLRSLLLREAVFDHLNKTASIIENSSHGFVFIIVLVNTYVKYYLPLDESMRNPG